MKKRYKILIMILSALIMGILFWECIGISMIALLLVITKSAQASLIIFSLWILLIMSIGIIYKYIIYVIKKYKEKKIYKASFLLLILIALLITIMYIKLKTTVFSYLLQFIYVVGVIVLPIIILGFSILSNSNNRKLKIIISVMLLISIYFINYSLVMKCSKILTNTVENKLIKNFEKSNSINIQYLENYKQTMVKNGYLTKYDIENILNIVENREDYIEINYSYQDKINSFNNKEVDWRDGINTLLVAEYYEFDYSYNDNKTIVNIKRYESRNQAKENEVNQDIVMNSNLEKIEVENKLAYFDNIDTSYFTFENVIKNEAILKNTKIDNFKFLFVFDEDSKNYIPYVENKEEINIVKSYKIYSTGMQITLNDSIELNKLYYSIRCNRYDEKMEIKSELGNIYYYDFEPVVTKMTDGNNNTVLEFKYNECILKNLKNIEILFGYNE